MVVNSAEISAGVLLKRANIMNVHARAHSHNDYEHTRPLVDALNAGFASVEADIYLVDGKLLVAHDRKDVRPERTLEALYLRPMMERIQRTGSVQPGISTFQLMVDIKANSTDVLPILDRALKPYERWLSHGSSTEYFPNALEIILSGDRPTRQLAARRERNIFVDARVDDLKSPQPGVFRMVSEAWLSHIPWFGSGLISRQHRAWLSDYVRRADDLGIKSRFWGLPDTPAGWRILEAAGVSWIGTDKLDVCAAWMAARGL
jgi:hypothetical protein